MIAVLFEVQLRLNSQDTYLKLAHDLREQLQTFDGFISIERFTSLSTPDKLLSFSLWRDDESIQRWYAFEQHQLAQKLGKEILFSQYRILTAHVMRERCFTLSE